MILKSMRTISLLILVSGSLMGVQSCPPNSESRNGSGGSFSYGSSFEDTSSGRRATSYPQGGGQTQQVSWVLDRLRYWIGMRGQALINSNPADVAEYCPNYSQLNRNQKINMWATLMTEMVRFESNYNPTTTYREPFNDSRGRPVISSGLFQISLESSQGYGCPMRTQNDLFNPDRNIMCSVQIMSRLVQRDNRIGGGSSGNRGGARYWAVLRNSRPVQRRAIISATRNYCANANSGAPLRRSRTRSTPVSS